MSNRMLIFNPITGKFDYIGEGEDGGSEKYLLTDGSNLQADLLLVIPELSVVWSYGDKTTAGNLTVEYGTIASMIAKYRWIAHVDKKSPIAVSGSFSNLTIADMWSEPLKEILITSNITVKVTLSAPKNGLYVESGRVVPAEGSISTSAQCSLTFAHRIYYGVALEFSVAIPSILSNTRARTIIGITTAPNEYYYIAYPKALGVLSGILLNDAVPAIGAFVRTEITMPNAGNTPTTYYVYKLRNIGSLIGMNKLKVE